MPTVRHHHACISLASGDALQIPLDLNNNICISDSDSRLAPSLGDNSLAPSDLGDTNSVSTDSDINDIRDQIANYIKR